MPRLSSAVKLAAGCCWLLLTVLSLLPGQLRPHTLSSGNLEHLSAYGVAAVLTQVGFAKLDSRWQVAAFSTMAASSGSRAVISGSTTGPRAPWAPWRARSWHG